LPTADIPCTNLKFALKQLLVPRGNYNIFHEYYQALVQALFEQGASRNVYCVNIDAVIATLLLKILWPSYRAGKFPESAMENAAFTIFLYARTGSRHCLR